jgi:parvulin-like peptidyl-prolyl isomerase
MNRKVFAVAAATAALAACDGFKEAMTAHVDVVARAGSQELSVTRLSELLGNSKAPLRKDVAKAVADLWVNYQLLGKAAAQNDSLHDAKLVDEAMWATIANARAKKWYDIVSKTFTSGDPAVAESRYTQGELLAARHILLMVPQQGLSTAAKDSIRRRADALRAQVTPVNFADVAGKNSMDTQSARQGGALGVFPRGAMVPEFEKALLALKPGEVSPVVQTQFGYHIIYRQPYSEVKDQVVAAADERGVQQAESTYFAKLESASKVQVRPDAAKTVKAVVADLSGNLDNKTVVATSTAGDFTAGRLAKWIAAYPPQAQLPQQIANAPDSVVPNMVRNFLRNELFLKQADSAKIQLDTAELNQIHREFATMVGSTWMGLGVEPKTLSDSAKTEAAKERVASSRIESYMDNLLMRDARFVDVPKPLEAVLHDKYDSKVNEAGLDRALERATKVRATMDSTRAANQPPSAVPMPGQARPGQGQPPAAGGQQRPAPKQPPQQAPQQAPKPAPQQPPRP